MRNQGIESFELERGTGGTKRQGSSVLHLSMPHFFLLTGSL